VNTGMTPSTYGNSTPGSAAGRLRGLARRLGRDRERRLASVPATTYARQPRTPSCRSETCTWVTERPLPRTSADLDRAGADRRDEPDVERAQPAGPDRRPPADGRRERRLQAAERRAALRPVRRKSPVQRCRPVRVRAARLEARHRRAVALLRAACALRPARPRLGAAAEAEREEPEDGEDAPRKNIAGTQNPSPMTATCSTEPTT
jgi:hypothetical protein